MRTYLDVFNLLIKRFEKESSKFRFTGDVQIEKSKFEDFLWKALEVHGLLDLFCFDGVFESFAIRCKDEFASEVIIEMKSLALLYKEAFYVGGGKLPLKRGWYIHFYGTAPFEKILERLNYSLYKGGVDKEIKPHCIEIFSEHFRKGGTYRELLKQMLYGQGELVLSRVERGMRV